MANHDTPPAGQIVIPLVVFEHFFEANPRGLRNWLACYRRAQDIVAVGGRIIDSPTSKDIGEIFEGEDPTIINDFFFFCLFWGQQKLGLHVSSEMAARLEVASAAA